MRAIYNGVDLMPLETHAFDIESVYDDTQTDYLFSRLAFLGRFVVNGQSVAVSQSLLPGSQYPPPGPPVSYKMEPGTSLSTDKIPNRGYPMTPVQPSGSTSFPFTPGQSPNIPNNTGLASAPRSKLRTIRREPNVPLLTHEAIRHRLSTPRGKLYIFSGAGVESGSTDKPSDDAFVTLEIPEGDSPCDCKNGPTPKLLSVTTALGDANTLIVDWSCEAYFIENDLNDVNPSGALLSNRFAQKHMVDQYGYTTIITAGAALFRTDKVYSLPESPDVKRPILFAPIPQGFVRENIVVDGLPDVTGISYSYRDRQVPVNFPAGPLARAASISAMHRQAITSGEDIFEGALSAYERLTSLRANQKFAEQEAQKSGNIDDAMHRLAQMIGLEVAKAQGRPAAVEPQGR